MAKLPDVVTLGLEDEARRLWDGACAARASADSSLVALCEALDLGVRAAEVLAIGRLQPVRDKLPATIGMQLDTPLAEVDVHRDAVSVPRSLQFTEILDLLSEESLACVAPNLHRGWEDRRFSCRRSRATAAGAVGVTLDGEAREALLLLAAYRNRLFRYPPPIRIVTAEILDGFPALARLVEQLTAAPRG